MLSPRAPSARAKSPWTKVSSVCCLSFAHFPFTAMGRELSSAAEACLDLVSLFSCSNIITSTRLRKKAAGKLLLDSPNDELMLSRLHLCSCSRDHVV